MSVLSTHLSPTHSFTKTSVPYVNLVANPGVEGDCHFGRTVQHRSRLHIKPPPANLRQVHLVDSEVLAPLNVQPGELGENITVEGLKLLGLGKGARLHFLRRLNEEELKDGLTEEGEEEHPVVQIEGLRNPCPQIDKFQRGLKEKFLVRDQNRQIVNRTAGVMGTVIVGGKIEKGMRVVVEALPVLSPLECV